MELLKDEEKIRTSPDCDEIYMPLKVLHDKRFTHKEKFYIALYYQYGDNEYFADKTMLEILKRKSSLLNIKRNLRVKGFFQQNITPEMAKDIVLKQKNEGGVCEWCGTKTNAIQEHHYPVPKCKGGKEVVKICPNCHYEYHLIYKGE